MTTCTPPEAEPGHFIAKVLAPVRCASPEEPRGDQAAADQFDMRTAALASIIADVSRQSDIAPHWLIEGIGSFDDTLFGLLDSPGGCAAFALCLLAFIGRLDINLDLTILTAH